MCEYFIHLGQLSKFVDPPILSTTYDESFPQQGEE